MNDVALGLEVETQSLRQVALVFYDQDAVHWLPTRSTPLQRSDENPTRRPPQ
jgi:hypothetical protein